MDLATLLGLVQYQYINWAPPSLKESEMHESRCWFLWYSVSLMLHSIDITDTDPISVEPPWGKK